MRRAFERGETEPAGQHVQERLAKVKALGASPEEVLAKLVCRPNSLGQTPLMLAARYCDEAMVQLLLDIGAPRPPLSPPAARRNFGFAFTAAARPAAADRRCSGLFSRARAPLPLPQPRAQAPTSSCGIRCAARRRCTMRPWGAMLPSCAC